MEKPIPPHVQIADFLPPSDLNALLNWTLENSDRFAPATVTGELTLNPKARIASVLADLGPLTERLHERLMSALPAILAEVRLGRLEPEFLEIELVAHGDGAHFAPHTDILLGPRRRPLGGRSEAGDERLLSAVFYYYAEPKAFSGGELRLYRFTAGYDQGPASAADYVEIEPLQNSLVAFPPWARHEVRPVSCLSGEFRHSRFALNCWYCAPLQPKSADKT